MDITKTEKKERGTSTRKRKMGTKLNLNFSPTSFHFSLSCSHDSLPAPRFNGASRARAPAEPRI